MAFVTGDVVAVSGDEMPFKVIFKQGETVLTEWLVESKEDGELQIVETLKSLIDDEDEEGDDDDCVSELRRSSPRTSWRRPYRRRPIHRRGPVDNSGARDPFRLVS